MREIQFRAWNEKSKNMIDSEKICNLDGDITKQKNESGSSLLFEQYTGLKDKNGVEIYEGDIVEVIDTGEKTRHQVRYCIDFDYPAFDLKPHLGIDCNGLSWAVSCPDCEIYVIGNIHENIELLEKT